MHGKLESVSIIILVNLAYSTLGLILQQDCCSNHSVMIAAIYSKRGLFGGEELSAIPSVHTEVTTGVRRSDGRRAAEYSDENGGSASADVIG